VTSIDPPDESSIEQAAVRLSRPALVPLVDELARRIAEGTDPARLTLRGLPPDSRRALADLLGSDRLPPADTHLGTERLLGALALPPDTPLRSLVERLRGPIGDRRAQRAAEQAVRDELWSWLDAQAAELDLGTGPWSLGKWVAGLRAAGVRGGVAAYRARLESALAILRTLPQDGVSLAAFASDHASDPHALDHGVALPGLVLEAVALASGQERPSGAEAARALWESVGVVPDPLSSTVLAFGLPGHDATPSGQWLSAAAAAGEPVVLTLANLRRWPVPPLPPDARLYVVENPSLVAEAAATRWVGPPIVCSSGRPSVATVTLLRQLTAAGAQAFQHADFDPAGLSITQWLTRQAGTIPWRMDAADYAAHASPGRPTIQDPIPDTPWDPALHDLLARERRPMYEEQVRAQLLAAMLVGTAGTTG